MKARDIINKFIRERKMRESTPRSKKSFLSNYGDSSDYKTIENNFSSILRIIYKACSEKGITCHIKKFNAKDWDFDFTIPTGRIPIMITIGKRVGSSLIWKTCHYFCNEILKPFCLEFINDNLEVNIKEMFVDQYNSFSSYKFQYCFSIHSER
jgi:hypothetical protein